MTGIVADAPGDTTTQGSVLPRRLLHQLHVDASITQMRADAAGTSLAQAMCQALAGRLQEGVGLNLNVFQTLYRDVLFFGCMFCFNRSVYSFIGFLFFLSLRFIAFLIACFCGLLIFDLKNRLRSQVRTIT